MSLVGSDVLKLEYVIVGGIAKLCFPSLVLPERADELWKHSCFEMFVGQSNKSAYVEFNFSPSRLWASYRFEDYRNGMQPAIELSAPDICAETDSEARFALTAWVDLSELGNLWPMSLGLSAVIEERDGRLSYWALAHPPGKPDFHHKDCFALTLPAPGTP